MSLTKIFIFITLLLISCSSIASLEILIDDENVAEDYFTSGCLWDHCARKADKLEKNLVKKKIIENLKKKRKILVSSEKSIEAGLHITVSSEVLNGGGRGYGDFAASFVTFGAAPTKRAVTFSVVYKFYRDGKLLEQYEQEFLEKRNMSVLSDTQKYKKKAAQKIAGKAIEILERLGA